MDNKSRPVLEMAPPPQALPMHVIYDHPKDFPDHFVVREHYITAGGKCLPSLISHQFDTLDDARESVRYCRICIPRHPDDDKPIVESWI